jgi:hypothetical protein
VRGVPEVLCSSRGSPVPQALGCVLYELCSLKRAFEGQSLPALIMKILRGKYPPLPFQYSPELQQLIADCLNRCARLHAGVFVPPGQSGISRKSELYGFLCRAAARPKGLSSV